MLPSDQPVTEVLRVTDLTKIFCSSVYVHISGEKVHNQILTVCDLRRIKMAC